MDKNLQKSSARSPMAASSKRTITLSASSEVACPPDLYCFAVSVTSTKESSETAQNSVKRRSEYIAQVLRNNSIKERHMEKFTDLNRVNEDEVCVQENILVKSDNLQACEAARNLLIAKMDATVQCSAIDLLHSPAHKTEKRRQSFKEAVANAKQKALSVAHMLELCLGPALKVVENSHHEMAVSGPSHIQEEKHSEVQAVLVNTCKDPSTSSSSLHERLRDSTEVYTTHVEVTFEVSPVRSCHHRKCPKH